jgi:hypothetical protein
MSGSGIEARLYPDYGGSPLSLPSALSVER